jgi:hypothetical protein
MTEEKNPTVQQMFHSLLTECERKLQLIQSKPPKPLQSSIVTAENEVSFRVALLRGVLLARISELADESIGCMRNEHATSAITLVRATIESMVMHFDLTTKFADTARALSVDSVRDLDDFVKVALLGRRYKPKQHTAVNIITRLDRMAKCVPAIKPLYEKLSEIAHPNSDGLVGCHLAHDDSTGQLNFVSGNAFESLYVAASGLSTTLDSVIDFDKELVRFAVELQACYDAEKRIRDSEA